MGPSFDVLPSANPALIPSQHVGKAKRQRMVEELRREKLQRLISGDTSKPTRKTAATTLPSGDKLVAPTVKNARLESAEDFAALRERVQASYARKNQGTFNQRRRNTVFQVAGETVE